MIFDEDGQPVLSGEQVNAILGPRTTAKVPVAPPMKLYKVVYGEAGKSQNIQAMEVQSGPNSVAFIDYEGKLDAQGQPYFVPHVRHLFYQPREVHEIVAPKGVVN